MQWLKRYPRLYGAIGVVITVCVALGTIQGISELFTDKPLVPLILHSISIQLEWQKILLVCLGGLITIAGIIFLVFLFKEVHGARKGTIIKQQVSNSTSEAIPTRRDATKAQLISLFRQQEQRQGRLRDGESIIQVKSTKKQLRDAAKHEAERDRLLESLTGVRTQAEELIKLDANTAIADLFSTDHVAITLAKDSYKALIGKLKKERGVDIKRGLST